MNADIFHEKNNKATEIINNDKVTSFEKIDLIHLFVILFVIADLIFIFLTCLRGCTMDSLLEPLRRPFQLDDSSL